MYNRNPPTGEYVRSMVEWFDWLLAFTVPTLPTLFHLKNTFISVRMVVYLILLLQWWSFMTSLHPLNILNYTVCTGGTLLLKWQGLGMAYVALQHSQIYTYLALLIPGQFYVYVGKVLLALFVLYHAQVYPSVMDQQGDEGEKEVRNHFTRFEFDYLVKCWLPCAIVVIDRKLQSRWWTASIFFFDCGLMRWSGHLLFMYMIFSEMAGDQALKVMSQIALIAALFFLSYRLALFKVNI